MLLVALFMIAGNHLNIYQQKAVNISWGILLPCNAIQQLKSNKFTLINMDTSQECNITYVEMSCMRIHNIYIKFVNT